MSRIIIGLGHRARQGKDEVARFLSKKYGFKVVHFSDELYQELYRCHIRYNILSGLIDILSPTIHFNITPTPEIREFIKEKGIPLGNNIEYTGMPQKEPILLQWWGTEFRRKSNKDYWLQFIEPALTNANRLVIPDVRFLNEAMLIRKHGGVLWKIERLNPDGSIFVSQDRDPNHPSEKELDNFQFDEVIQAMDGDLESLFEKVEKKLLKLKIIQKKKRKSPDGKKKN